jgi:DNA-binding NarL/FixJ family response regulator
MRTYVRSLHPRAYKVHIGTATWITCGTRITSAREVLPDIPPGFVLCALCASSYDDAGSFTEARRRKAIALLCEGRTDDEVALLLDMGLRTVVRHVSMAQAETGAKTRMHLGYLLGRAEGERRSE